MLISFLSFFTDSVWRLAFLPCLFFQSPGKGPAYHLQICCCLTVKPGCSEITPNCLLCHLNCQPTLTGSMEHNLRSHWGIFSFWKKTSTLFSHKWCIIYINISTTCTPKTHSSPPCFFSELTILNQKTGAYIFPTLNSLPTLSKHHLLLPLQTLPGRILSDPWQDQKQPGDILVSYTA